MDNAQIIFIVGCPRSGTTLLRDLLIADDRVAIPDEELQVVPKLIMHLNDNSYDKLISLLKRSPYGHFNPDFNFDGIRVDGQQLQQKWVSLFSQLTFNKNASFYGEKTPENYQYFDLLIDQFPTAKFLFVTRDPRDVVMSMRSAWGKSYLLALKKWKGANKQRQIYSSRADIYMVVYEELLENSDKVVKQIGEWLGCERLNEVALNNFVQSREVYGDSQGMKGIVSSNRKKYYKSCPKFVHFSIEYLSRDEMYDLNYQQDFVGMNYILLSWFYFYSIYDVPASFLRTVLAQIKHKGLINGLKYKTKQILNKYGY